MVAAGVMSIHGAVRAGDAPATATHDAGRRSRVPFRFLGFSASAPPACSPYNISLQRAAERGFVDDVISPASTRTRLCEDLEVLRNKTWKGLDKKHSNIPL